MSAPADTGSWQGFASSSDGTKLVTGNYNSYIYTSTDSGVTWTPRSVPIIGIGYWRGFASSADGTKLVTGNYTITGEGGYIYTSTDSGVSWVKRTLPEDIVGKWLAFASSSDGTKLVVANYSGYIYTSTNSGVTWTIRTGPGVGDWFRIASSSDGTKLLTANAGGYIYTSTDSGVTWVARTGPGSGGWWGFGSSSDGTKLVTAKMGGYVYTSTDSGVTWVARTGPGVGQWHSCASSEDGTKLIIGDNNGHIHTSTDSGVTWVQRSVPGVTTGQWYACASSSDGKNLVISNLFNGYIYTSTDYGVNWRRSSTIAPFAPNTLTLLDLTSTGFTMSWTGATGAMSYTYAISPVAGTYVETILSGGNGYVVYTGLSASTSYTLTITSVNTWGSASSSTSLTTKSPPPTGVSAVAGIASATVSWTAPSSDGGSAITGYTVTPSTGSPVTVGNVLTTTLTGLTTGTPLTFTVFAIKAVGTSAVSLASSAVTPMVGPPSSVLGVTGIPGVASATINWTAPISNGGLSITGYKVICLPDNKKPNLAGPNDRSLVITGLKNTLATTFKVVAINTAGQSDSVTLTSYILPGVPRITAVRGASGIINLTWTAKPSNVGSPITGYVVTLISPLPAPETMVLPNATVTATGGSVSISGLTNGTSYVFSVKSVSAIGQSAGGISRGVIPATLPNAPTSFTGTRAVTSAGLSWVAPTNTGGLPITGYTISYTLAGVAKVVNLKLVTSTIIKGLVNDTAYTFTIQATNLIGPSIASSPVSVTPGTGL
jgi:hypothetical protein